MAQKGQSRRMIMSSISAESHAIANDLFDVVFNPGPRLSGSMTATYSARSDLDG
jgi:hypothetical protein